MFSVNADSKAQPKGNQAPQEQQQPRQAKQHSSPRDYLGMEKLVRRHGGPVECRGEQDIEIEQGKRRDQKIRLVYISESHRFYALSSQDRDSGQYHPSNRTIVSAPRYFGIKILYFCILLSRHSVLPLTLRFVPLKADLCDLIRQ